MNTGQADTLEEDVPASRMSRKKHVVPVVGLTVAVSLAAIVFVRPSVRQRLEVRSACQDLSNADYDARINAIRRLRSLGEETESELISLLHHLDEGVRIFAASELAHRTQVTDDILEAFLLALEGNQHVAEIPDPTMTEVRCELEWTFPLAFAEIIMGDGESVTRQRVDLSETDAFGEQSFRFNVDVTNQRWLRVEVRDIATNGAFTQPVWLPQ